MFRLKYTRHEKMEKIAIDFYREGKMEYGDIAWRGLTAAKYGETVAQQVSRVIALLTGDEDFALDPDSVY